MLDISAILIVVETVDVEPADLFTAKTIYVKQFNTISIKRKLLLKMSDCIWKMFHTILKYC